MPEGQFHIVPVDVTNAHHVGTVFRSIYGEDFPVRDVYEPGTLCREIESGRLISLLAFDMNGQTAGYASMYKTAPNPRLWEAGNLAVVPAYKYTDISLRLIRFLFNFAANSITIIDGIFVEAVCSHYFTQVNAVKNGMVDCALELDQLDGESFKDERNNKAGTARVSCALYFRELTDLSEAEFVPARYNEILRQIAGSLRPRILFPSIDSLPTDEKTILEEKYYASARTWKTAIQAIGSDWTVVVEDILDKAGQRQVMSLQVTVNMACPHIGSAVDLLRKKGFFFGGMFPRWFGTDGLLMQKLFGSERQYEKIKLYTPFSRELLAFIKSDCEAVRGV